MVIFCNTLHKTHPLYYSTSYSYAILAHCRAPICLALRKVGTRPQERSDVSVLLVTITPKGYLGKLALYFFCPTNRKIDDGMTDGGQNKKADMKPAGLFLLFPDFFIEMVRERERNTAESQMWDNPLRLK